MPTLHIPVTIPTKRIDGTPLAPTDLARILLFVSTDLGNTFVSAGAVTPDKTEFVFDAPDAGVYQFKAQAVDLQEPALVSLDSNVSVVDTTPPVVVVLAAPEAPVLGAITVS